MGNDVEHLAHGLEVNGLIIMEQVWKAPGSVLIVAADKDEGVDIYERHCHGLATLNLLVDDI